LSFYNFFTTKKSFFQVVSGALKGKGFKTVYMGLKGYWCTLSGGFKELGHPG